MSGRSCSVCADPRRPEIDKALVAGDSMRVISRHFAPLSHDAIRRHRPHIARALVEAGERKGERREDALLRQIQDLQGRTLAILTGAEKDGRRGRGLALGAVRQIRENILAEAKLLAELKPAAARPRRVRFELEWGQSARATLRQPAEPSRPGVEGDDERPDERDDEDREPLQ
ncbi:MAG TPA: hypothetical protein VF316_04505 [Polyangiaceae bacterium]